MSPAKSFFRKNALLSVALLLSIVLCINVLVRSRLVTRLDLTESQEYSLSDGTKKILHGLSSRFQVKAFVTNDMPSHLLSLRNRLADTLEEYQAYGRGKIAVDWVDPKEGRDRKEAEDSGIAILKIQDLEGDKVVQRDVAAGLIFRYKGKEEVLPFVQLKDLPTLEYQLTTLIKSMVSEKKTVVGFLTSEPPAPPQVPGMPPQAARGRVFDSARTLIGGRYEVRDVQVQQGDPIPADVAVLVVLRPKEVNDLGKLAVDQFLMGGGKVLFCVDRDDFNLRGSLSRTEIQTGLDDLFEHYGFRVEKEMILDQSMLDMQRPETIDLGGQQVQIMTSLKYPFWVQTLRESFSTENVMTSGLDAAQFFWVNPVTLLTERTNSLQTEVIVRSSSASWLTQELDRIFPERHNIQLVWQKATQNGSLAGQSRPIAVSLAGKFSSFFKDKKIPQKESSDPEAPTPPAILTESEETRILVVGDAHFLSNDPDPPKLNLFTQFNQVFFQNMLDWLSLDQDLIGIRTKTVTDRSIIDFEKQYADQSGRGQVLQEAVAEQSLEKVEEFRKIQSEIEDKARRTRNWIRWSNILGMPLLVVAFGTLRFFVRRKTKLLHLRDKQEVKG